ncbi:DUF2786 domain-containing protein [Streptomyces sp. NPDC058657]|uniref:DUF2786 domain-containing protein n=1 Tax=unclassified Streptomyces TaxID=2593676 RepID=UPI00364AB20A
MGESPAEQVERAVAAAVYGGGGGADDTGLDLGASLLAAAPWAEAGRELLRRGEELLRRAWGRGWQPADVARLVRRDLGERHLALLVDLLTAENRRHARVPARWEAQLRELGAHGPVFWRSDERYGDALAGRERTDRFSLATAVLELFRALVRLPAIEPVGPAPGDSVPLRQQRAVAGEPRMLTRIRALLAKAEGTEYPEEAEALTAKAQELMARHSIDEAVLAAQGQGGGDGTGPGACRIGVDAPYETAKAILLDAVATANRCRAVWNSEFGFSTVVGFDADLEAVELLYTSLLVQGTAAMTRAEAAQRAGGRKRTKSFRQSFLTAYASRLGTRLAAATEHVVEEAGAGDLLPVLAARDVAVTDRAEQMFPRTTSTRVRGVNDLAGWEHGTAAADRASVPGAGAREGRGRLRPGG